MSEDWMRDRIIMIERELGGHAERTRSLEQSDALIRREIAELGARITDTMNSQHAHLRGELSRLTDAMAAERTELRTKFESTMTTLKSTLESSLQEAVKGSQTTVMQQRQKELTEQNELFKDEIEKSKRTNQRLLFVFGVIIVLGEKILEYAPAILEMFKP
jgi:hypothetical protein